MLSVEIFGKVFYVILQNFRSDSMLTEQGLEKALVSDVTSHRIKNNNNKSMASSTYLDSQLSSFHQCASKLMQLQKSGDEVIFQELNTLLDQLNSCDYNLKIINDSEVGEKLLCHCVSLVPLDREHLVTKFCPVIIHLIRRQNVVPNKETLSLLLEFLFQVIRCCSRWVHSYALLSMATLLYENSSKVEEFWELLVGLDGVLIPLVTNPGDSEQDKDILRCGLRCIENLTLRTCVDKYLPTSVIQRCFRIFLTNLQTVWPNESDEFLHCKVLVTCLVGIQNLINGSRSVEINVLGELLAALKFYIFYSMPGQSQLPASFCLYPSPLSQHYWTSASGTSSASQDHSPTKGLVQHWKSRKRQTSKKRDSKIASMASQETANFSTYSCEGSDGEGSPLRYNERFSLNSNFCWSPRISSSESEYSDSEGGQVARLRSVQSRVRQSSLEALASVVKTVDRKVMFGYWSSFLPDVPSSTGTLASCLLKDPAPKVRSAALAVLITMLEGSKQFLALIDEREKVKPAFTTLSATLSSTVRELHRSLILALVSETSPLVLTRIVKCIGVLVQTAPVHKLSEGFLTKISKHLQPLLKHRDSNVKVAALTAFGAIVEIRPQLPEVSRILCESFPLSNSPHEGGNREIAQTPDIESVSWLVELCLESGALSIADNDRSVPLPIRLESLQVLAVITKNYFVNVRPSLNALISSIQNGLSDPEASVKLHSAKLLEELGRSTSLAVGMELSDANPLQLEDVVSFWTMILGTTLPSILQDSKHPALQAKGCDCIATLSAKIFPLLPSHQQVLCETILLGLSADEDKLVKATATRALGVLVLFPSLTEQVAFVVDVTETVIAAMEDRNLEVRLKTAWTLGNVTEAFMLSKERAACEFVEELPDSLLCKLAKVALNASHDNDRVRSNGVRALGNLLRYFHPKHLEKPHFMEIVCTAVNSLLKCASTGGNMKVRWNACYALGNMLHNTDLDIASAPWRGKMLTTLGQLTKDCKNFKVRINAAAALSVPSNRRAYGTPEELSLLWQQLVNSLDNIQSSMDFVEYQHHDHLVEQICSTIFHLMSLLEHSDISSLSSTLGLQIETLISQLQRYISRVSNVNTNLVHNVLSAEAHLSKLRGMVSHCELQCLDKLLSAIEIDCT